MRYAREEVAIRLRQLPDVGGTFPSPHGDLISYGRSIT
jgi:hypothetical protein